LPLPGALQLVGPIITASAGLTVRAHDGVVPIDSSMWTGFAGCIPADHLDITRAGETPASQLAMPLVPFYQAIAAKLATL
jgi:hypothetical protein